MSTATRLMTADEFLAMPLDGMRHELVRGEVTTMSLPGGQHGEVASEALLLLGVHVKTHGLGKTYAAETGFIVRRDPDTVRGADVAFVRRERRAQITAPEKYVPFAPDLAIEVASPNDRPAEIAEKTRDWLEAGTRLVWNVDPRSRTATVHRPGQDTVVLAEDDALDGAEVVPGFRCRVKDLFA